MPRRQYLLKPDKEDKRDLMFTSRGGEVPDEVDLRPNDLLPIYDQGYLGSCTANAICALHSFLNERQDGYHFYLSRLFLYYKERELEGTVEYDAGAYIRDGMKVMKNVGCAGESTFPYIESTFRNPPTEEAYRTAQYHKLKAYHRIMTAQQLKEALANRNPVVMGVQIYNSFESVEVARTGVVPFPDRGREYSLGGHAVLAMGYKKINGEEYIICRNSWGANWGDKGYFYMPMSFIGHFVSDMWVGEI